MNRRVLWILLLLIPAVFLDRFAYYGARSILTPWLTAAFDVDIADARGTLRLFTTVTYSMPMLGALVAIGIGPRFALAFGALFAMCGYLLLAIAPSLFAAQAALVVLGTGSGMMKPCMVAALADALPDPLESARNAAFAAFYLAVNAASFGATLLAPFAYRNGVERGIFGSSAALALLVLLFAIGAAIAWRLDPPKTASPEEPYGVNEWWKPVVGALALAVFSIPLFLTIDGASTIPFEAAAPQDAGRIAAWNPAIVAPVSFVLVGVMVACVAMGVRVRALLLLGIGFVVIAAAAIPVAIAPASLAAIAASAIGIAFGEVFANGLLISRAVAGHHWRVKPLIAACVLLAVPLANALHGGVGWVSSSDRLLAERIVLVGAILFTGGLGLAILIGHRPLSRFFWPDPAPADAEAAEVFD